MIGETNAITGKSSVKNYNIWTRAVNNLLRKINSPANYLTCGFVVDSLVVPGTSDTMFYCHYISQSEEYSNTGPWIGYCIFSQGTTTAVAPAYKDNTGETHISEQAVTVTEGDSLNLFVKYEEPQISINNIDTGDSVGIDTLMDISFDETKPLIFDKEVSASDGITTFEVHSHGASLRAGIENAVLHRFF